MTTTIYIQTLLGTTTPAQDLLFEIVVVFVCVCVCVFGALTFKNCHFKLVSGPGTSTYCVFLMVLSCTYYCISYC